MENVENDKLTITQDEQKFFTNDNNYIEYFFEVGIKPDVFSDKTLTPDLSLENLNSKIYPEIISKFPYFPKKSMTIDSTIIDFIFPKDFELVKSKTRPDPIYYSVILDNPFYNADYCYKYIGCLKIFENLNTYKYLYDWSNKDNNENNNNNQKNEFDNIYVPKCLCLASLHPNFNKFELILLALYNYYQVGSNDFFDIIIEKLICQTPKIPRGIKKIELKIGEQNVDLSESLMNDYPPINVSLKLLFNKFNIKKIVDIYKLLLFETKMIFFSSKIADITHYIMCFTLLLRPFVYQYRILSILPKKYYFFLEDDNPSIFGVNEAYNPKFFIENKLVINDNEPLCVVDLDNKTFYTNKVAEKLPGIPDHLRDKLDKRTEDYRKSKRKSVDKDEDYQEIFYRFMINLLLDYNKYFKQNSNESYKLDDIFDIQGFINMQNNKEKEFYKKIINSQMFVNFVIKRLMPRDTNEKINALFFEEKLNIKYAQKKIIRGSKILEQNTLIPSKEFSYEKEIETIYLTEKGVGLNSEILEKETLNYFFDKDHNINKKIGLLNGYLVKQGKTKNDIKFEYFLFPTLLSEELFKYNCKNYSIPSDYNSAIMLISEKILKNCIIKIDEINKIKSSELLNDVYLSYFILFSLCLWYMDKEERKSRFNNVLQIISKIDKYDMEIIELLFNSLINLEEEELAVQFYTMLNQMHINLSWSIFSKMSKILHTRQNIYSSIIKDIKTSRSSSVKFLSKTVRNSAHFNDNKFRARSIKLPGVDDNILGEEVYFDVFGICLNCKNRINLEKICDELSQNDLDKNKNQFRCKNNDWNVQKLKFKIGTELYNKNITKKGSSYNNSVLLYSPTNLKKKLLDISHTLNSQKMKFDVDKFRLNYPEEFWNCVWYFKLKNIDISFMLPYITPVNLNINKVPGENCIDNFINFIMEENRIEKKVKMLNKETKNPNIKIIKQDKIILSYNNDTLFIQQINNMTILPIIGMISYKNTEPFIGNIKYKGNIIEVVKSNINQKKEKKIEKKIKLTKKDSILTSNNLITSDFDLTISTNASHNIDKNDENNKNNNSINNSINVENERKSKVRFSNNDNYFEDIKEDDENYIKFKEYKEDDGSLI